MTEDKNISNNSENQNNDAKNIKVRTEHKSGLSDFIQRPLPNREELDGFEKTIKSKNKDGEIEENLSDIYKDKKGKMVDVSKLNIKRKKGFWHQFFNFILVLLFISLLLYGVYWFFIDNKEDNKNIHFNIQAPKSVLAGEEFYYTVEIFNPSEYEIRDLSLDMNFSDNFIYLDSDLNPVNNYTWNLDNLKAKERTQLEIKGMIIDKASSPNVSQAIITYMPSNFSSYFQETKDINTLVSSHGFGLDFDYLDTALVGELQEVSLLFDQNKSNYIKDFNLQFQVPDNIEIIQPDLEEDSSKSNLNINVKSDNIWSIDGFKDSYDVQELKFHYRVKEKKQDKEQIGLIFSNNVNNKNYQFFQKNIDLKVMKSDLNVSLMVNGAKSDETVNFGDDLNYRLVYQNKGEVAMENVTIMLVVDSSLVDWNEVIDENKGLKNNNTIAWSKVQIPDLAQINPEESGSIDLILPIKDFQESYIGQDMKIKSYAQFNMENSDDFAEDLDNRSNEIISHLNSDLSIEESVLYYSENNMNVGSGPIPPEVGETTMLRVYWDLSNNLHDLSDVIVSLDLPDYVKFEETKRVDSGNFNYNEEDNLVEWDLGSMSNNIYQNKAEFDISINPRLKDEDKILIISPGANVSAVDEVTKSKLETSSPPTTTKLEEDDIVNSSMNNDGRVKP